MALMRSALLVASFIACIVASGCGKAPVGTGGTLFGAGSPDASLPDAGPDVVAETDAGIVATAFAGDCPAAFPGVATRSWRHPIGAALVTAQGSPNHRSRDQVVSPGEPVSVRAHFTYGVFDKDLEDEEVQVWLRRCPGWELLGTFVTDDGGVVLAPMPTDLAKGEYRLAFLVQGDGTRADGLLAVWPAGTQAVVTDVDGTLTTDDWQAVEDVLGLGEGDMYPDANTAMASWAKKGYRLLYLTGRPQIINRYTREWLDSQGFPTGPVQLTDSGDQIWPTDEAVRAFKAGRLTQLAGKGVIWRAAYGNALTDIGAYADAHIDKADTYIVGPNAGVDGTQAVSSYAAHLPVVAGYPPAAQP